MIDFRAAFRSGQEAAERAELARKEIDQVFVELNQQLSEPTGGNVVISRHELEKRDSTFGIQIFGAPVEKYWVLAAQNPKAKGNGRQLCNWEQSHGGYPCKISWDDTEHVCNDRESLQEALAFMLSDPTIGEQISRVMQLSEIGSKAEVATATAQ